MMSFCPTCGAAWGHLDTPGVEHCRDRKFDLQLGQALIRERRLAAIFAHGSIEKVELKSESYQWEQTGNICIEYQCDGRPSGISTTEADYWVHELCRDGETLGYFMFPIDRLKAVARDAWWHGGARHNAGDGGRFDVVVLPISAILR